MHPSKCTTLFKWGAPSIEDKQLSSNHLPLPCEASNMAVKMQDDVDIDQISQREYARVYALIGHALNYQNFLPFDSNLVTSLPLSRRR
jgi:hypothetical protein